MLVKGGGFNQQVLIHQKIINFIKFTALWEQMKQVK